MGMFGLGKQRFKHRRFDYVPRHYDPEKEALQRRLARYQNADDVDTEQTKARIRGSFKRQKAPADAYNSKVQKRSNRILLITLIILVILTYQLLTVYLPRILESLE